MRPGSARKTAPMKPAWNENITDMSRYQLSNVEQLQHKVSCSSKNRLKAHEEVAVAQQKLREGKFPTVYMDAIMHKVKKENLREVYRQKAKAIVYPLRPARCASTCRGYQTATQEKDDENPLPLGEVDLNHNQQPCMVMKRKVADLCFTSVNDQKLPPPTEPQEDEQKRDDAEEMPRDDLREKNYLDCDENIKKLNMLKEEIVTKDTQIEDYMAGLNAALGMSPLPGHADGPAKVQAASPVSSAKDDINNKDIGDDESELERISRLIAETHKDIDRLNIGGDSVPEGPPSVYQKEETVAAKKKDAEDSVELQKYENSFFHTRGNKENSNSGTGSSNVSMTISCPSVCSTGIISRKISNKSDISLAGASGPRQLIVASEYYKAATAI